VTVHTRLPADPTQLGEPALMSATVAAPLLTVMETDFAEGEIVRGLYREADFAKDEAAPGSEPTINFTLTAALCDPPGSIPECAPPPQPANATIRRTTNARVPMFDASRKLR
jgi:hypothetical protein